MKKILFALVLFLGGVIVAAFAFHHFRTDTVVVARDVGGVPVIEIEGPLDPAGARKIVRALRKAESRSPSLVVLSFDPPGGEISCTLEVADAISTLSVPTAGLVREGGGGTLFMIAAVDRIYFTRQGLCGSVAMTVPGDDSEAGAMARKLQAHLNSRLGAYAAASGHDAAIFLGMSDPEVGLMTLTASEALTIGLSAGTLESPEAVVADAATTETGQLPQ